MARSNKKSRRSGDGAKKGAKRQSPKPDRGSRPSVWDSLSDVQRHLVAVSVLFVIALGFFAPVNFQGKMLAGTDAVQSRAMGEAMERYQEETGEQALWSPNVFSGTPGFLIRYSSEVVQVDSILKALRKVAYPTIYLLFLTIGVYLLTFTLTKDSLASLLAGVAAGLTTYIPIILHAGHNTKFITLAWVPWILIAFRYALKRPGPVAGLLFAVAVACGLRAMHVQIVYQAFFLMGFWWLVDGIGARRDKKLVDFAKSSAWLIVGTGLAVLMVAQPYWSQYEHKQFSTRGGTGVPVDGAATESTGLGFEYAMGWSQGVYEMLTYLIAGAIGGGPDGYWGEKLFTSGPHYLGGIILALALAAVIGKRSRVTTGLAVASLGTILFALGGNLSSINRLMFDYFPLFNAFRAPEIWLHMFELSAAILAAIGLSWIVQSSREAMTRRVAWATVGGVFGLTIILLVTGPNLFSFEKENEREQTLMMAARQYNTSPTNPQVIDAVDQFLMERRSMRIGRFGEDAGRTAIFLGLALAGLFLFFRRTIPGFAFAALVVLLVTIDLWGMGARYFADDIYVDSDYTEKLPRYPFDDYIISQVEAAGGPGHFRTLSLEASPVNWTRGSFHYELSSGYHPAKMRVYQELLDHLGIGGRGGLPNETMLDLTGTRFIVSRQPLPNTTTVFVDESGLIVLERPEARWMARNQLVGDVLVVADDAEALGVLKRPDFNRLDYALLKEDVGALAPVDSSSVTSVELLHFDPRNLEWRIETDGRRLFVTSEVYYPAGWTATIDGEPAPILQVNHAFRGLVVPPGEHIVRMHFAPVSHELGTTIAWVATLLVYGLLAVLLGLPVLRRRREESQP